jgi:hypothetical protein
MPTEYNDDRPIYHDGTEHGFVTYGTVRGWPSACTQIYLDTGTSDLSAEIEAWVRRSATCFGP